MYKQKIQIFLLFFFCHQLFSWNNNQFWDKKILSSITRKNLVFSCIAGTFVIFITLLQIKKINFFKKSTYKKKGNKDSNLDKIKLSNNDFDQNEINYEIDYNKLNDHISINYTEEPLLNFNAIKNLLDGFGDINHIYDSVESLFTNNNDQQDANMFQQCVKHIEKCRLQKENITGYVIQLTDCFAKCPALRSAGIQLLYNNFFLYLIILAVTVEVQIRKYSI